MDGVDYESDDTARRYVRGRALAGDVLDRWRVAVTPHLPHPPLVVLDVGAGTGIFARAWPTWCPCDVIALEPAAAMRAALVEPGLQAPVVAAGRAEALPLRATSVDVVWMSAVIHHLQDLDQCAVELRRVLRDGGVVFVRGLFADLGMTPGLEHVPGWRRAIAAFPSVDAVEGAFASHDLRRRESTTVVDAGPTTPGDAAERIRTLRSADTLLRQFTDDEITAGLTALTDLDPAAPLPPAELGLLVFEGH